MSAPAPPPHVDLQAWPTLQSLAGFTVVAVAASTLAEYGRRGLGLPLITGYILVGVLCGPFAIGLLDASDLHALGHIINDDAMGFIGFSAGSKFLLSELRGQLRLVMSVLLGLVGVTYALVLGGLMAAAPFLPLTANMEPRESFAVALLVACLAVARSPSSAIALVSELGAQGRFTTAVLSVTVLMDVIVVLLFAVTLLTVHAIAPEAGEAPGSPWQVLGLFGFQLLVSALVGLLLAAMLHALFKLSGACEALEGDGATNAPPTPTTPRRGGAAARIPPRLRRAGGLATLWLTAKLAIFGAESLLLQLVGFEVFQVEGWEERQYGAALHNPLVISMISGFTIVNYTSSRKPFLRYAAAPQPCHPPPPCEAPRLSACNSRGSDLQQAHDRSPGAAGAGARRRRGGGGAARGRARRRLPPLQRAGQLPRVEPPPPVPAARRAEHGRRLPRRPPEPALAAHPAHGRRPRRVGGRRRR